MLDIRVNASNVRMLGLRRLLRIGLAAAVLGGPAGRAFGGVIHVEPVIRPLRSGILASQQAHDLAGFDASPSPAGVPVIHSAAPIGDLVSGQGYDSIVNFIGRVAPQDLPASDLPVTGHPVEEVSPTGLSRHTDLDAIRAVAGKTAEIARLFNSGLLDLDSASKSVSLVLREPPDTNRIKDPKREDYNASYFAFLQKHEGFLLGGRTHPSFWRGLHALAFGDPEHGMTGGDKGLAMHSLRVGILSGLVTKILGFSYEEARDVALAAALHDSGKIHPQVHDVVMLERGLKPNEREIMQRHPEIGALYLAQYGRLDPMVMRMILDVAHLHHENWGGTGYPFGLKQNEIPGAAAIVHAVDCLDALVDESRKYRRGVPIEEALEIMGRMKGSFHPTVLAVIHHLFGNQARPTLLH